MQVGYTYGGNRQNLRISETKDYMPETEEGAYLSRDELSQKLHAYYNTIYLFTAGLQTTA